MYEATLQELSAEIGTDATVEGLGGNIVGIVVRRYGVETIVTTDDGATFTITACAYPNTEDHDHTDDIDETVPRTSVVDTVAALAALAYVARRGREDGAAAASWVFDGNTTAETYARYLKGLDDVDPAILHTLPDAPLSGEWADGLTPDGLAREVDAERYDLDPTGLADAYEDAWYAARDETLEVAARYHVRETALNEIREENAYSLAVRGDCYSPDSLESLGAHFLTGVRDAVLESAEYHAGNGDTIDSDAAHEIADNAVPIYTHERWQTFVDLGAYREDVSDLTDDTSDLERLAGIALYMIAERVAQSIIGDLADETP